MNMNMFLFEYIYIFNMIKVFTVTFSNINNMNSVSKELEL